MPHVIVKLFPGRTKATKQRLAEAITRDVVAIAGCTQDTVSVAIEEIPSEEWDARVRQPEILARQDILYKHPGTAPPEKEPR